jgi:hypothetical protein
MTYLNEAPAPTAEQLEQIAYLEKEAARKRQSAADSFERCDTDGFVSQWASQIGADKDRKEIALLKNGGYAQFPVLCDENGNVLATKVYSFADKYRPDQWNNPQKEMWRLPDDEAEKRGRKWVPTCYIGKSRIQKKLGLHEESRWFPACAKITTGGRKDTGFSGMANAFVAVFKKGENGD